MVSANSMLFRFLLLCGCSLVSCKDTVKKPNVILIMTDDLGWYDVGFNGNKEIITPNLDRLANQGVIFDRFYAASAVCSPTRASVLTGRNPLRMNIPTANQGHLLEEEITIPEILKENGYATGHFGKWHLGTLTQLEKDANRGGRPEFIDDYSIPTMNGYDVFFCTESKVPTYDPMIYPESFVEGEGMRFGWKAIEQKEAAKPYGTFYWEGPNQKVVDNLSGDNSEIIMNRVIPFVESSVDDGLPFFTTIWMHTPHLPVVSDSLHRQLYNQHDLQKQIYYGTITALDDQIGRLWSSLEKLGIEDDTMIWFCSDNGPENGTPGSAGIYRERKRSLFEGGVRVPAFVLWPKQIQGGVRIDFPSVTSDYLPSLLDMLELPHPQRPIDGQSLADVLSGKQTIRENPIGFLFGQQVSWVDNDFKLISTDNGQNFELYDLISDQSETINVIDVNSEIASKMKEDLFDWLDTVEDSKQGKDYN